VAGVIVRQLSEHYSNFRATGSFEDYLRNNRISGIQNVDTRSLVLHLRTHGSQMGVIGAENQSKSDLVDIAKSLPTMDGLDLAKDVSTKKVYLWNEGVWSLKSGIEPITETESTQRPHVVAMDFGIKFNILRLLVGHGFRVTVVPADTTAEQIIKLKPDGLFLSNGPGDPAAVSYAIETVRMLLGKMPIFGICLGHQILGLAFNAPTFKLKFGHRGGNHPVRNELTGKVEITVQNHGFATSAEHVPSGVKITHINLNDNTIEGLEVSDISAFSVQYHPESSPGPHDALYLFKKFRDSVDKWIN
jgi:carbamoyl-phosphate synthase small subunit